MTSTWVEKSLASSTSTSRNTAVSLVSRWLSRRTSSDFSWYSSWSPAWILFAMNRTGRVLHQHLVEQLLGGLVERDLLDPQLGGAADAGDQRDDHDHRDEDQRDEQALGAVEDGDGDRVDEHGGDDAEEGCRHRGARGATRSG